MKKVALILEGKVAKKFMEVVVSKYFSNNFYLVITKDQTCLPASLPSTFEVHLFDPTSAYKLYPFLDANVNDILIVMEDVKEQRALYEIIRNKTKEIRMILSLEDSNAFKDIKDDRLLVIDRTQFIAQKFIAKLPNVPSVPQGFGLGQGEVMEIGVPFGSVFAYRHLGSLRQKDYKIVGVYRKNEFHLSHSSMVIQPRDQLLVVGNPDALNSLYLQVKSNVGQFPVPFGRDIYLYVDMGLQDTHALKRDIDQALILHEKLKSAMLYIQVLNPTDGIAMQEIRNIECQDIRVVVDFKGMHFIEKLHADSQKKIGLAVVGKELFSCRHRRRALFEIATPVFKTNARGLKGVEKSMVVLNEDMEQNEDISSVMFDVCGQMNLDMLLYDFDPDKRYKTEVIKNYEHLSHIYNCKIKVIRTYTRNPVLFLNKLETPVVHFLPFESCIAQNHLFWMFSTKVEQIAFLSDAHPQMFIPVVE
ncbi:COG3400 family protein [Helicobacter mehlei]|uniref:Potassium transporter TrkA n=1 Tax=Helicobacter mehlei TaxID=2316080 RepID=A0A553V1I7_9HELI|nr:TrkA C-terminal domain-containing protein [Helicobacter mehlei]TSA86305.1 potassium transporter TrkA [Helicobacter mehlei]